MSNPQISAHISEETKKRVEAYVNAYGVKKGFFIESALLHHLQALQEIPEDLIVSPKIVVSKASGEKLLQTLKTSPPPTRAMKELFRDD